MTKTEFETLNPPLQQALVSRSFLGEKYLFLDEKTRVRYGFSFSKLGTTYMLQRKGICWFSVAWTYTSTHGDNLKEIIKYLFWYEEDKKQPKNACLF